MFTARKLKPLASYISGCLPPLCQVPLPLLTSARKLSRASGIPSIRCAFCDHNSAKPAMGQESLAQLNAEAEAKYSGALSKREVGGKSGRKPLPTVSSTPCPCSACATWKTASSAPAEPAARTVQAPARSPLRTRRDPVFGFAPAPNAAALATRFTRCPRRKTSPFSGPWTHRSRATGLQALPGTLAPS